MTPRFPVNIRVSSLFVIIALLSVVLAATAAFPQVNSTTTVVGSSPVGDSVLGQAVTFTATVTSGGPTPTGEVLFSDRLTPIFRATLNGSGVATFTTSRLAVGAHSISVDYLGDASSTLSSSSALPFTTNPRPVTFALSLSPTTVGVGAASTATVIATDTATTGPGLNRGAFVLANNLQSLRNGHAATLLRDGTVLITGGKWYMSSVELYNPATGVFTNVTGNMNMGRWGHTATLLDDGRVLITGGDPSWNSAELYTYDPVAGTGSTIRTGYLRQQRSGHTATLLPDGKVLIVAGTDVMSGAPTDTAEVYDPATGMFSAVASGTLSTQRSGHSATLLAYSGGVATLLIAGGDATGTVELITYNTANNKLFQVGSASWAAPRTGHTATLLLDGTVLIAGGSTPGPVNEATAVFYKVPADLSTFSTFSTFASPTSMNIARSGHTATLLDNGLAKNGLVLLVGGVGEQSAEVYTPSFSPQGTVAITSDDPTDQIFPASCTLLPTANGSGTCSAMLIPAAVRSGTRVVTGTFTSDASHNSGYTDAKSLTVVKGTQASVYVVAPSSAIYGQPGLSAVATGGGGTGSYTFSTGASTACSVNAVTGALTITRGTGICAITATRAGDVDYNVSAPSAPATIVISQRPLTVTATGVNRIYNATAIATVTLSDDRLPGDVFSVTYAGASFADKKVGVAKTVAVSGISISGPDVANYTPNTTATTTADITPFALTMSFTANSKIYTSTPGTSVSAVSDNRFAGDVFTPSWTAATFNDKNAGEGKTVTITGISLSGPDAANYTFNTTATTTANIIQLALGVSATGVNKVYDGNQTATVTLAFNPPAFAGDIFTISYATAKFYLNKNVGVGKEVRVNGISLSGPDADNYFPPGGASTTADITPFPLVVTATGVNRAYNATPTATVTLADNRITGDVFTSSYANATFADKNVGVAKAVTVTGISIAGADAANYTNNATATATATVSQIPASVTPFASSKSYGSADPVLTGTLTGFMAADGITAAHTRTAGETVAGGPYTISATLSPVGVLANYDITYNTAAFTITKATASVTPSAASKTYGSADPAFASALTGFVAADGITATHSRTPGETVAGGPYTISATLNPAGVLANYNVTYNTAAFTINKASATVTPNAATKIYGSADPAGFTGTLAGFVAADNVTATYSRATGETVTGGPYPISAVLSPAGALANYNVTHNPVAFTLAPAPLTVTANDKTRLYGAANPSLDGTVSGVLNNDGITATYSTASIVSSNAGTYPITATLVDPNGRQTNYALTSTPGTMTVTPAPTTTVIGTSSTDTLVGTSLTLTATVALASGTGIPTGTVTFKDGAATLGTGSLDATGKATFSFSSTSAGLHSITAAFGGSLNTTSSASTSASVNLQDFAMPATPPSVAMLVGQSTTSPFTVTPTSGFTGTISFTCAVPASMSEASCAASAVQISGTSSVGSVLTVVTTGPRHVAANNHRSNWYAANAIFLVGFAWLGVPVWRRRRIAVLTIMMILVLIGGAVSCGGGASGRTDPGTLAGNYTLAVTATSGTAVHTMNVPVTVR